VSLASPSLREHSALHNPNSQVLRSTASLQRAVGDVYRGCNDLDGFAVYNAGSALELCSHLRTLRHQYQQQSKERRLAAMALHAAAAQHAVDEAGTVTRRPNRSLSGGQLSLQSTPTAASESKTVSVPRPAPLTLSSSGSGVGVVVAEAADTTLLPATSATNTDVPPGSPDIRMAQLRTAAASASASASATSSTASAAVVAAAGSIKSNDAAAAEPKAESVNPTTGGMCACVLTCCFARFLLMWVVFFVSVRCMCAALRVELIVRGLLDRCDFFNRNALRALQEQTERVYAAAFTDGYVLCMRSCS
jgi:hypothetical protein